MTQTCDCKGLCPDLHVTANRRRIMLTLVTYFARTYHPLDLQKQG